MIPHSCFAHNMAQICKSNKPSGPSIMDRPWATVSLHCVLIVVVVPQLFDDVVYCGFIANRLCVGNMCKRMYAHIMIPEPVHSELHNVVRLSPLLQAPASHAAGMHGDLSGTSSTRRWCSHRMQQHHVHSMLTETMSPVAGSCTVWDRAARWPAAGNVGGF